MHDQNPPPESGPAIGVDGPESDNAGKPPSSHAMWPMVACCAPMVLIALAILLGVFGPR